MPKKTGPKVHLDRDAFDAHQMELLHHIALAVKNGLTEAGIAEDNLSEVTASLTFNIAAILDGSEVIELEGKLLLPCLTFAMDDEAKKLLATEGGSWMHEYAHGICDELFESSASSAASSTSPLPPTEPPSSPITVAADAEGWAQCPKCNFRFNARSTDSFIDGRHRRCSQLLSIVFQ